MDKEDVLESYERLYIAYLKEEEERKSWLGDSSWNVGFWKGSALTLRYVIEDLKKNWEEK